MSEAYKVVSLVVRAVDVNDVVRNAMSTGPSWDSENT